MTSATNGRLFPVDLLRALLKGRLYNDLAVVESPRYAKPMFGFRWTVWRGRCAREGWWQDLPVTCSRHKPVCDSVDGTVQGW